MLRPTILLSLVTFAALGACADDGAPEAAATAPAAVTTTPAPAAPVPAPAPAPATSTATVAPAETPTVVAAAPATGPSPVPANADAAFCKDYEMFSRELALLRQRGEERDSVEAMARTLPDGAAVNSTVALAIIERAWTLPVAGSATEKDAAVAAFKTEAAAECQARATG